MAEYDNTNKGALFKNQKKESDNHPDYNGSINIDGVEYWQSAWIKEGKSGKFFSQSFKRKDEQSKPTPKKQTEDLDNDLPF